MSKQRFGECLSFGIWTATSSPRKLRKPLRSYCDQGPASAGVGLGPGSGTGTAAGTDAVIGRGLAILGAKIDIVPSVCNSSRLCKERGRFKIGIRPNPCRLNKK